MEYYPSSSTTTATQYSTGSSRSCVVSSNKKEIKVKKGNNGNKNNNGKRGSKGVMKLSTDPQSVAARERRHRISDRFRILQSLIPGGAKMDTVSMLEEAIHYVKFLKNQIWLHQTMINCQFVDDQEHYQDLHPPATVLLTPPDHHQTTLDHDSANAAVLDHQPFDEIPPMVPDCFFAHQGYETMSFGHAYVRYKQLASSLFYGQE